MTATLLIALLLAVDKNPEPQKALSPKTMKWATIPEGYRAPEYALSLREPGGGWLQVRCERVWAPEGKLIPERLSCSFTSVILSQTKRQDPDELDAQMADAGPDAIQKVARQMKPVCSKPLRVDEMNPEQPAIFEKFCSRPIDKDTIRTFLLESSELEAATCKLTVFEPEISEFRSSGKDTWFREDSSACGPRRETLSNPSGRFNGWSFKKEQFYSDDHKDEFLCKGLSEGKSARVTTWSDLPASPVTCRYFK